MNTSQEDKNCKGRVIEKCWGYLNENFHKFSESNKIKIALALCTKDIPTQVEGKGFDTNIFNIIGQLQRDFQESGGSSLALATRDGLYPGRTRQESSGQEVSEQEVPGSSL